eukprot:204372_1
MGNKSSKLEEKERKFAEQLRPIPKDHLIKLGVLGGESQGKTALVMKFITGSFIEDYDPTIEESFRKNVTVNNYSALIDILDTAGEEIFWSMQEQWIRESEQFLLVFSICSPDGFETCDLLRNK